MEQRLGKIQLMRSRARLLLPAALFLVFGLACSTADLIRRDDESTPAIAPTRTLAPTFTSTPEGIGQIIVVTPPAQGTPGVIIVPPGVDPSSVIPIPPTATPGPPATDTPLPPPATLPPGVTPTETATPSITPTPSETPTPSPTATFTPMPSATPYIQVPSGLVSLRTGPGLNYPLVAQLGPDIPVAITGQNTEGTWYQICCVNGQSVWVAKSSVITINDPSGIALQTAGEAPTPTETGTPTVTPTVTATATSTPYPFAKIDGPQFFPTENEFLTIWAKLDIGLLPGANVPEADPAEGYFVEALFEGVDRPPTNEYRPSFDHFEFSAPPGAGNRVEYNFKYEYTPPNPDDLDRCQQPGTPLPECLNRKLLIGEGTWTIFVVDGLGNQLSDAVTFETRANNPNREVYIAWRRYR
ncbi:MAG: hypothetical protein KDD92_16905 [Caldilineaceae bacterium]|nr:hypothetical protein [Caldilineaceae bacterium]